MYVPYVNTFFLCLFLLIFFKDNAMCKMTISLHCGYGLVILVLLFAQDKGREIKEEERRCS